MSGSRLLIHQQIFIPPAHAEALLPASSLSRHHRPIAYPDHRQAMNDAVIERLSKRLQKCPIEKQFFESGLPLRLHLVASHSAEICRKYRVAAPRAEQATERPETLYLCGHCMTFAVPNTSGGNAISELADHTRSEHPNPEGPTETRISVSTDTTLIDSFLEY